MHLFAQLGGACSAASSNLIFTTDSTPSRRLACLRSGFFCRLFCHIDFSASQFSLAAEAPGGVLGLLGLIGEYLQAKRKVAAHAK